MDTSLTPHQLALLETVKHNVKLAQTLGACGFAVCLWDTLAYLHIEYRVVWLAKLFLMKAAYLFTRYITILTGILFFVGFFASFTPSSCNNYVKVFPAMGTLPLLGCTFILIIRAYKLSDKNKTFLAAMVIGAAIQEAGMLAISLTQTISAPVGNGISACIPNSKGATFVVYWILPTVLHTFLTAFTSIKSWRLTKSIDPKSTNAGTLFQVGFSRYGQIFPVSMIVIEFLQIVFYLAADPMQRAICSPLSGMMITILACQSILHGGLDLPSPSSAGHAFSTHAAQVQSGQVGTQSIAKLGGVRAFITQQRAVDVSDDREAFNEKFDYWNKEEANRPMSSSPVGFANPSDWERTTGLVPVRTPITSAWQRGEAKPVEGGASAQRSNE